MTLDWTVTLNTVANTAKDQLTRNGSYAARVAKVWDDGARLWTQETLDTLSAAAATGGKLAACRSLPEVLAVQSAWMHEMATQRAKVLNSWLNLTTALWQPSTPEASPVPTPPPAQAPVPVQAPVAIPVPVVTAPEETVPVVSASISPVPAAPAPAKPTTPVMAMKPKGNGKLRGRDMRPGTP